MNIKRKVRENIKRLRLEAGLSQQKLADMTGKSLRYINYLERNDSNVTVEVLDVLARGLGVPITSLISDLEEGAESNNLRSGLVYIRSVINEKLVEIGSSELVRKRNSGNDDGPPTFLRSDATKKKVKKKS